MSKPEFLPTITLGNLLTVLPMIAVLAVIWGQREADMAYLKETDSRHEMRISENTANIRTLERSYDRTIERLDSMKTTVERIDKKLP